MYLLESDGRSDEGFAAYREYVAANAERFPAGALSLAQSDWYYGSHDHRSPHDARLETMSLAEQPGPGEAHWQNRLTSLEVTLRGAYDDGHIRLRYPAVHSYRLDGFALRGGHTDWRYDELRLDEDGRLVHEIEWCGMRDTARWLIVADDIELCWRPDVEAGTAL
ncbi:hypothetical protein HPO96_23250 [Kribbella sandramycini]|uniref:Uncharacterized protein n=1 Tax=Kribbella sandramycini TaxID=60450 RepID=A0A7Y4L487_9ACTN|nr:hypothetical protein [Kribbella sandramycini]MBB6566166.1 hypothetical protein [Kribbella sandramycini]NOL43166.1 hypothetical protein [Kribbella sandramycini]